MTTIGLSASVFVCRARSCNGTARRIDTPRKRIVAIRSQGSEESEIVLFVIDREERGRYILLVSHTVHTGSKAAEYIRGQLVT
jgi:hypothetical protein